MSGDTYQVFNAAAVQASPVFLDRDATVEKACRLIEQAAERGSDLVVFPEVFIPAYPLWSFLYPPMETHGFFHRLFQNAVRVPSPQTEKLGETARQCGVVVSIGINEKADISMGAIWNTNLLFDLRGALIHKHRKLVPTYVEKLSWANGDGAGIRTVDTDLGRLGVLICGENTNPLARFALLAQGEQVHISTYPPAFPFRRPGTANDYDLGNAIRVRAGAHSFEGKVFNVVAAGAIDDRTIQEVSLGDDEKKEILRKTPRPVSVIVNPNAEVIAGPLDEPEGIIVAKIDLNQSIEWKQVHDVVGYYNRFDVFRLLLNQSPQVPVQIIGAFDEREIVPSEPLQGAGVKGSKPEAKREQARRRRPRVTLRDGV